MENVKDIDTSVAITGSPNNVNTVHFDVRSKHLKSPLLGALLSMHAPIQNSGGEEELLVLGQVAEIETQNRWHEDLSLKNYIKLHGKLPHLTEIGDVTVGELQIIGAYKQTEKDGNKTYDKTRLSVPPGSGLDIDQVDRTTIEAIMEKEKGYGYLGNFYGSQNVPAPVFVRHFGDYDQGGNGESYMGGVFGPSGSGKSVIAATLIALWAHNPSMGLLILDPQSEFSENAFARGTNYDFDFHDILKKLSGNRFDPANHVIGLDQLQLEGTEIFVQILAEKGFFHRIGLSDGKIADAIEEVTRCLDDLGEEWNTNMDWDAANALKIKKIVKAKRLEDTVEESFADCFTTAAASSYSGGGRKDKQKVFLEEWGTKESVLKAAWNQTVGFFKSIDTNGKSRFNLRDVINETMMNGSIRILDLNPQAINMRPRFKLYLMDFVFKRLREKSYIQYRKNQPGNCLIVMDEAGRYIPQDTAGDTLLEKISRDLVRSVAELRKMRCGFMFIAQTIAGIQKEIYRNLHYRIYGVGLGVGADADHIKSKEGDKAFELYRSLPDPRLSQTFSFMVGGALIALGSSGRPMVIEGFSSGSIIIDNNKHLLREVQTGSSIGEAVTG
ncbi:MAG: helicase HerA domain-containing protein [Candidatus Levyibacteriota bacterium]